MQKFLRTITRLSNKNVSNFILSSIVKDLGRPVFFWPFDSYFITVKRVKIWVGNKYFVPKLFWPIGRKLALMTKIFFWKFTAEGWEIGGMYPRNCKHFEITTAIYSYILHIETECIGTNNWDRNLQEQVKRNELLNSLKSFHS